MTVICPKCQYENRADTTQVVCARCATLIEVRTTQGATPVNDWGATDLSQRVTKPMSNSPGAASVSANGSRRDPYATRLEPEADEVLDIPRVSNSTYPVNEPGAIFEEVLSPSQGVPKVSEFDAIPRLEPVRTQPVENLNPYIPVPPAALPIFQPPPVTPPPVPENSYSVPAEFAEFAPQNGAAEKGVGWPMLPEDSPDAKSHADGPLFGSGDSSRGLLGRVLAVVLVFGVLCAAAWYFLAEKFLGREVAVNKPPIAQPARSNPPTVSASKSAATAASTTPGTAKSSENTANTATQPAKPAASDPTANKAPGTPDPNKKPAPSPTSVPAAAASGKPLPVPTGPSPTGPSGPSVSRNEGSLTVQVGSYKDQAEANQKAGSLKAAGVDARVIKADIPNKGTWYRVQAGRFTSREEAARYGSQLKARGSVKDVMVTGYQAN